MPPQNTQAPISTDERASLGFATSLQDQVLQEMNAQQAAQQPQNGSQAPQDAPQQAQPQQAAPTPEVDVKALEKEIEAKVQKKMDSEIKDLRKMVEDALKDE